MIAAVVSLQQVRQRRRAGIAVARAWLCSVGEKKGMAGRWPAAGEAGQARRPLPTTTFSPPPAPPSFELARNLVLIPSLCSVQLQSPSFQSVSVELLHHHACTIIIAR